MTDKELTALARTVGALRDERAEQVKDALAAVFAGLSTPLAPAGGMALMAGWLLWALDAVRR